MLYPLAINTEQSSILSYFINTIYYTNLNIFFYNLAVTYSIYTQTNTIIKHRQKFKNVKSIKTHKESELFMLKIGSIIMIEQQLITLNLQYKLDNNRYKVYSMN